MCGRVKSAIIVVHSLFVFFYLSIDSCSSFRKRFCRPIHGHSKWRRAKERNLRKKPSRNVIRMLICQTNFSLLPHHRCPSLRPDHAQQTRKLYGLGGNESTRLNTSPMMPIIWMSQFFFSRNNNVTNDDGLRNIMQKCLRNSRTLVTDAADFCIGVFARSSSFPLSLAHYYSRCFIYK